MNIIIVKSDSCTDHVRVKNFIKYFDENFFSLKIYCWLRNKSDESKFTREEFIMKGGGYSNNKLLLYYPLWVTRLLLKIILAVENSRDNLIFAVDFESALPVYIYSFFKPKVRYIYDVHDDFAMRYNFPSFLKKWVSAVDKTIKSRAFKVIHVDENRIREGDDNYIIIYNSQLDFYENKVLIGLDKLTGVFAFTGLIGRTRGVCSVERFARKNKHIKIIAAGKIIDKYGEQFVNLENVEYLGYVNQETLFEKIQDCQGIFSLYDTSKEINVLAASNKLYDSVMLGVPVIVNEGLSVEHFVKHNNIGHIVSFEYGDEWNKIMNIDLDGYNEVRRNGRLLYLRDYAFDVNVTQKLDDLFSDLI